MPAVLQRRQPVGVDVVELAADVVDRDAHHEDGHEHIQEDPHLHQQRLLDRKGHPEGVDAVFHGEVAQHLGHGLAS
jgi:hypothetical protein